MTGKVVVVGSLSMDLVLTVPRLPVKGETIKGSTFDTFFGGKGNNQAIAAAKLGATVAMLGKVGADAYGKAILANLEACHVDAGPMLVDNKRGSGIANIWVGPSGENSIVIIPNANGALSPSDIQPELFKDAAVLLLQLEIPLETVTKAAQLAHHHSAKVILNPAPAPQDGILPKELLTLVDVLIPNESEALLMTGIDPVDQESAIRCGEKLLSMGPKNVVLTLGERGAMLMSKGEKPQFFESFKVTVVDSTAAGDAFVGAFGAMLASGATLSDAVRYGCAAGSLACTKAGAAPSLPSREELEQLLKTSAR